MASRYACAICHRRKVRLYRIYGNFLRDTEIVCNEHLPAQPERGWWVPLVSDTDGSVWGYTSAPADAIARWRALPDAAESGPLWIKGGWIADQEGSIVCNAPDDA